MKNLLIAIIFTAIISCKYEEVTPKSDCVENFSNQVCNTLYDPVCGCNNKTYGNACTAVASGISNYTQGECKKNK